MTETLTFVPQDMMLEDRDLIVRKESMRRELTLNASKRCGKRSKKGCSISSKQERDEAMKKKRRALMRDVK